MSSDSWPPNKPCSPATNWGLSMVSVSQLQVAQLVQIVGSSRYPAAVFLSFKFPHSASADRIHSPHPHQTIALRPPRGIGGLKYRYLCFSLWRYANSIASSFSKLHFFQILAQCTWGQQQYCRTTVAAAAMTVWRLVVSRINRNFDPNACVTIGDSCCV